MKKAVPVFLFAILIAVFGFQVRSANAYSSTSNCVGCHTVFAGGSSSSGHQGHLGLGLPNKCQTCHAVTGDTPQTSACAECHFAPGLPLHHDNAGVGQNCTQCHTGPAVPENTPVPGYSGLTNATLDPCDGSEQQWLSKSLDNDGDQLYDMDDPDCQAATPPQIDVNPASHNFGNVPVGNSASQEFTISNTGEADLHISAGVLSDETNFAVDGNSGSSPCGELPVTITPNDLCTVLITFSPQMEVLYTATVTVSSDDPVNPSLVVDLSGNGVTGPAPNLVVTPASVDFGQVNVGDTPAEEVTLYNTGTDNLVVSGIALDNAAVYSLDETGGANPCGSLTPTIFAGDNCTFNVIFAPAEDGGPFTATVMIDSNTPSVDVPVTGTGFLDTDGDGVSDSVDNFPNDNSKATPQSATGTGKITVDAGSNALSNVSVVAVAPGQAVSGFTFPDGLLTFQVTVAAPRDNAVVTLTFPSGQPPSGKYFKDDGSGGALVEFDGDRVTINTDNVVLMLTDGGSGDNDNTEDGVINDPGGLGTPVSSGGGGDGGGSCSVIGSSGGGGALLFLTLLAILVTLRLKVARARRLRFF